ncbi:MAG: B12-binding domain-containing protein [Candidatus Aminicenantes bacterium]
MEILEGIVAGIEKGDADSVRKLSEKALKENLPAVKILNKGLVSGMNMVGDKFKNGEIFIPEVLVSAKAMKAGMEIVKPLLAKGDVKYAGKIVIGTVKGDLHDIGKNIVAMLLEGAGFEVINLGTDVSKENFLESAEKEKADIIGLSALLTTTMLYMKEVIDSVKKANLDKDIKVIIGGAPISQSYAEEINADGYAPDATSAVELVKNLLK